MDPLAFLKNISINLRATGPAAVVIAWLVAVTALGYSTAPMAGFALGIMLPALVAILGALGAGRPD